MTEVEIDPTNNLIKSQQTSNFGTTTQEASVMQDIIEELEMFKKQQKQIKIKVKQNIETIKQALNGGIREVLQKQTALAKSVYVKGGGHRIANGSEKMQKKVVKSMVGEQGEETVFDMLDELSLLVEDLISFSGGQQNHGQFAQSILE